MSDALMEVDGYPLYRCPCGKQHLQGVGKRCPCGEPFPSGVAEDSRMNAAIWFKLRERGGRWWL